MAVVSGFGHPPSTRVPDSHPQLVSGTYTWVITFVAPYAATHPALTYVNDLTPNPAGVISIMQGLETTVAGSCTATPGSSTVSCASDVTSTVLTGQYFSINGFTSKIVSRAFTTATAVVLADEYNLGAFSGVAKTGESMRHVALERAHSQHSFCADRFF